ncbi:MAG: hypothetical protein AB7O96_15015 [Pseudobdellovibrionaceae bacterium]
MKRLFLSAILICFSDYAVGEVADGRGTKAGTTPPPVEAAPAAPVTPEDPSYAGAKSCLNTEMAKPNIGDKCRTSKNAVFEKVANGWKDLSKGGRTWIFPGRKREILGYKQTEAENFCAGLEKDGTAPKTKIDPSIAGTLPSYEDFALAEARGFREVVKLERTQDRLIPDDSKKPQVKAKKKPATLQYRTKKDDHRGYAYFYVMDSENENGKATLEFLKGHEEITTKTFTDNPGVQPDLIFTVSNTVVCVENEN